MRFLGLWNSVPVAKVPRGFLVAGWRRVVTSNWLVDDEAAASLIYCFCANWRGRRNPRCSSSS